MSVYVRLDGFECQGNVMSKCLFRLMSVVKYFFQMHVRGDNVICVYFHLFVSFMQARVDLCARVRLVTCMSTAATPPESVSQSVDEYMRLC